MIIHLAAFKRGIAFRYRELDWQRMQGTIIVSFAWLRNGSVAKEYRLTNMECGGLEFCVQTNGHLQGWRLRGPVEHFNW